MTWTVETLNETVDDEIASLPASLSARLLRIAERIETVGLENVGEPHVKHVEGKLWEIRAKGPDGIARAIYVTVSGRRVVILHVFVKKSHKAPATALAVARERAKQVTP